MLLHRTHKESINGNAATQGQPLSARPCSEYRHGFPLFLHSQQAVILAFFYGIEVNLSCHKGEHCKPGDGLNSKLLNSKVLDLKPSTKALEASGQIAANQILHKCLVETV